MTLQTNFPEYMRDEIVECPRGHQTVWCGESGFDGCPTCERKKMQLITDEQIAALALPEHVVAAARRNRLYAIEHENNAEIMKAHSYQYRRTLEESDVWIARNEYTTREWVERAYEGAQALYEYHQGNARAYADWCRTLKVHRGKQVITGVPVPEGKSHILRSDPKEARRIVAEAEAAREAEKEGGK